MTKKSNFEQIIADILDCFPKSKRHIYELMLRRCNFTDPGEPLFPVMLFLLFIQDNLKEGSLILADEVKNLSKKLKENKGTVSVSTAGTLNRFWKYAVPVILILQLVLTTVCLGTILLPKEKTTYQYVASSNAGSAEIQSINRYWDAKIEHINKEKVFMNWSEIFSDDILKIVIPALGILIVLIIIQIIMATIAVVKLHRSNAQIEENGNQLQHSFDMLMYPRENFDLLNFPQNDSPATEEKTPVADISGWGEIDSGPENES